jgi:hypothetical protein
MIAGCNCGRRWRGLAQAHCPTCHRHFSSVDAYDRHRPGSGGCQDPSDIRDKLGRLVYKREEGPFGTTWVRDRPGGHYRTVRAGRQEATR